MPEWHLTPARRRQLVLFAVLAVVAGALAFGTWRLTPAGCGGCHEMAPYAEALDTDPHAAVSCYACHVDRSAEARLAFFGREVFGMWPRALVVDEVTGAGTRVARAECVRCHEDVLTADTAGSVRMRHASCTTESDPCTRCHGSAGHGATTRWPRGPVMEDCLACHDRENASAECGSCHVPASGEETRTAEATASPHVERWDATHGMARLGVCATCHEPVSCAECHGLALPHGDGYPARHSAAALALEAPCEDCHDRAAFCDACHVLAMPHPVTYLRDHATDASSVDDARCAGCHDAYDCASCHRWHDEHAGGAAPDEGGTP